MSTRGIIGVVIDGEVKATYNHSDSYPEWLGADIVKQIADMLERWGADKMRDQARKLVLVSEKNKPTSKQIKALKGFANLNVGEQSENTWYCLLRELQGNLIDTLVVGYMIDSNSFANNSLFCEWGYLVNLDDGLFEVYSGIQKAPHDKGRFAWSEGVTPEPKYEGDSCEYYPINLIAVFPLNDIPADFVDICEFSSKDLWTNDSGIEFTDVGEAINSLAVGEICIAYDVYDDDKTPSMKATRGHKDNIKIENIEED